MQKLEENFRNYAINNSDTDLAKTVFFVLWKSLDNIRTILDSKKIIRDDVAEYTLKVQQRQQIVNQRLVEFGNIISGTKVLDACCWPEWSSLAVLNRWAEWYWNEISEKTYKHLINLWLNVKHWTAERLPFKNGEFDYTIYAYAINNIQATLKAFQESNRVLKENWEMLIADPWITVWLSDIILLSIAKNIKFEEFDIKKILKKSDQFENKIPKYFDLKKVDIDDYVDVLLNGLLWINRDVIINDFNVIVNYLYERYILKNKVINKDRLQNYFHKYINSIYWQNIVHSAQIVWMELDKVSFYNCYKKVWEKDWNVTEIIDIEKRELKNYKKIFMDLQLPNKENSKKLFIWKKRIQNLLPTIMFKFKKK